MTTNPNNGEELKRRVKTKNQSEKLKPKLKVKAQSQRSWCKSTDHSKQRPTTCK